MNLEKAESIIKDDTSKNLPEAFEVVRDKLRDGYILFPVDRVTHRIEGQMQFAKECADAESFQTFGMAMAFIKQALEDDNRSI